MKIVLLDEAQQRFEAEDDWWRANRDAKDLLLEEFEETLEQLRSMPQAGQRYKQVNGKVIRRVLMKKTRCHVYYHLEMSQRLIEIYSVWGAMKGQGPKL